MKVTFLAPAYNEEEVIHDFVVAALVRLPPESEVLVVDDGSTDATSDILTRLQDLPRLRVVTHPTNRGLGAALRTGFAEAAGEVVITMDADLSHSLDLVPELLAQCETADAVFASRYVAGGGMVGVPLWRRVISRVANVVLRLVYLSPVRDLTTGFRAYKTAVVRDLEVTSPGFEAQLEISVRLLAAGRIIREVPLVLTVRKAGVSKMRYMRLIPRYGAVALRMFALRWLRRPPPDRRAA